MKKDRHDKLFDIISKIGPGSNVAIFPHVGVDGDCLGSTLALADALSKVDVNAFVVSDGPIPNRFDFMPQIENIKIYDPNIKPDEFVFSIFGTKKLDFGILVDCANPDRIGNSKAVYEISSKRAIIDHHYTVGCKEDLCCIDSQSSASGELIYDYIKVAKEHYKKEILSFESSFNIFTAIFSDTGGFRYSNTNPNSLFIAGDLLDKYKINNREISYNLFEKTSKEKIKLEGMAFSSTRYIENGKIAICLISKQMIEECNAKDNDVDGICAQLRNIEGVEAAFVLREKTNNEIRGNIRSSDKFDASAFAVELGGGGHVRAAGFSVEDITLQEVFDIVSQKSKLFLKK